jgi:hypothetical protein
MLDWKKASMRPNIPFMRDELRWDGHTPDGFFYNIDQYNRLQLLDDNIDGFLVVNTRCVKNDSVKHFKLYVGTQNEWSLNRCPPAEGYGDKRWYFVNSRTREVYVANHNGETIKKALEGTEVFL